VSLGSTLTNTGIKSGRMISVGSVGRMGEKKNAQGDYIVKAEGKR
jgi:hypothetical protein